MTTICKDDYVFNVDIKKTKEYYGIHSLCQCVYCRNYYKQIKGKFEKLEAFLFDFGVDISKPDELSSIESDNDIDYLTVDYTVCGKISAMGNYEININDNQFLSIVITNGYASPNQQTGDYFTLSVVNITLPWILEEPFPIPKQNRIVKNVKKLIQKFFKA